MDDPCCSSAGIMRSEVPQRSKRCQNEKDPRSDHDTLKHYSAWCTMGIYAPAGAKRTPLKAFSMTRRNDWTRWSLHRPKSPAASQKEKRSFIHSAANFEASMSELRTKPTFKKGFRTAFFNDPTTRPNCLVTHFGKVAAAIGLAPEVDLN